MNAEREGDTRVARGNRNTGCHAPRFSALCFLLPLVLLLTAGTAQAEQRTTYLPANVQVVLQRVPPSTDPRVRRFEQLRNDLKQHPHDASKAVTLAHAYIDYGRSTGDARFLGRAMAVIEPWMQQPSPPIPVLLVHATIQQSRHFFQASREELATILKRDPDNAQAWLTLATVAMVQGDVALANRACVQLANSGGDFMGMTCSASLRSLTGHAEQAYALLSLVEDPGPKAPADIKAWIEGLLADTAARMGKPDVADAHFKSALQWTPGDNFLLADYGDFLLDQGRAREVIDLVGGDTQSDTSFLRLVYAETALGLPRARADAAEMSARFESMDQRGSHVYEREKAGFVLHVQHDPQRALELARQNWTVQRAPPDARIYLEAALAAHDAAAAKPVLDFIARTHLSDAIIDPLVAQAKAAQTAAATSAISTSAGSTPPSSGR
jgi:tetratricopeptide (TPR) repeat protein